MAHVFLLLIKEAISAERLAGTSQELFATILLPNWVAQGETA
jgi:hypothetical protein